MLKSHVVAVVAVARSESKVEVGTPCWNPYGAAVGVVDQLALNRGACCCCCGCRGKESKDTAFSSGDYPMLLLLLSLQGIRDYLLLLNRTFYTKEPEIGNF